MADTSLGFLFKTNIVLIIQLLISFGVVFIIFGGVRTAVFALS